MKTRAETPTGLSLRCVLSVLVACALISTACHRRSKLTPEQELFLEQYRKIQNEMSKQQVDSLMSGYPAAPEDGNWEEGYHGEKLVRPAVRMVEFTERVNPVEQNLYIHVYFDAKGCVVGKESGAFMK